MIDFKKITSLALLTSIIGTGSSFAAKIKDGIDETDNNTNPPTIQQTTPTPQITNEEGSPPSPTITTATQAPEIGKEGDELESQQLIAMTLLADLELIEKESDQVAKERREEVEKTKQIIIEAARQLEEQKKKLAEDKRLLEEEKAENQRAASNNQAQTIIFGYTPERAVHNIGTEVSRFGESVVNLVSHGKFASDKKLKKAKKAKKRG